MSTLRLVTEGALLTCSFGTTPGRLALTPNVQAHSDQARVATIANHKPHANIPMFGMCNTQGNPQVLAMALQTGGAVTSVPCVPATHNSWAPGETHLEISRIPALTSASTCVCQWGGLIRIVSPGTNATVR